MKNILFFAILLNAQLVIAGQINDAVIDNVAADSNGIVRVTLLEGREISIKPSCSASSDGKQFTYDLNSPAGPGWHSMVLSAQASKKKVHFIGKNSCLAIWGTTAYEEVSSIYVLTD